MSQNLSTNFVFVILLTYSTWNPVRIMLWTESVQMFETDIPDSRLTGLDTLFDFLKADKDNSPKKFTSS